MKKLFLLLFFFGMITACEDVIDVDLNTADPRLVIEASINLLEDGTAESDIILTTTTPFFDQETNFATDAIVEVTSDQGTVYPFTYLENGVYQSAFIPQDDINYTLTIFYKNETYTATEKLYRTNPLEYVEQFDDAGFTGDDIELRAYFTDPIGKGDYYYFEGFSERGDDIDFYDDDFFDGNQVFGLYLAEDLTTGDVVTFNLYGINQQFYNFAYLLSDQTASGGPFDTQPATVKGNMINVTNESNYPFGYFRISEKSTLEFTVQ